MPGARALQPRTVTTSSGASFTLQVEDGWDVAPVAEDLGRCRFMAMSPDGRLFVPDMVNLGDNSKGSVWILEDFDEVSRRYRKRTKWLGDLRNPNSVAFWTDPAGTTWIYLALTDRLVRRKYAAGEPAPSSPAETLATYPDRGLSYKYGGWHLTRTVAIADEGSVYVSVGSSCNACEESEPVRATVQVMRPDGSGARTWATGLRNAVGLRIVDGVPWCTAMGADHLGPSKPDETLHALQEGRDYGWPWAYEWRGRIRVDPQFAALAAGRDPKSVPLARSAFPAHAAPLGLDLLRRTTDARLAGSWLVALHGSTTKALARGYEVVRVPPKGPVVPFVTGFLQGGKVLGRPCDVLEIGEDRVLVSDDRAGVIWELRRTAR